MHINRSPKAAVIAISTLFLLIGTSISFVASAQQTVVIGDAQTYAIGTEPLEQAKLDQLLAPIALYPDSLLSQILVAATYPLEVVQANRWRQANQSLTEDQVIAAIEDKQWDPSVKALTPFTDLIARLSKDLDWLQQLGDAFLQNEGQVLASVQELRQKARDNGSIADNDYYDVVEEDNNIIIKSTRRDIVYVPYYDSRVVYGPWGWRDYQPVYWHRPSHYRLHAGFYWSDRFYIRPTLFFGGFHWSSRNLVVNHHFYDRPYRHSNRYRDNRVSDYRHWNHNPVHRRGVRYSRNGNRNSFYRDQFNSQYRASRPTGEHRQERRRVGNRIVSNIPKNRETLRRTERNSVQQQEQNRRDELRVERRDRDNSGRSQQRRSNRVQRPTIRTADTTIVNNRESYRRRISNDRSVPNQQSASRPARTDSSVNRRNNAANVRTAPVATSPPKRTVAPRQSNVDSRNNSTNNRSSARNTSKYNPRQRGSNTRSHKQPN